MRSLSFGTKLMAGTILLVTLTVCIMGLINVVRVRGAVEDLGRAMIKNIADEIYKTVELQNSITQEKIDSDLAFMDMELAGYGRFALDEARPANMTAVNQVTKAAAPVTMPTLMAGGQAITGDFAIVDKVQKAVGGTATIFQVLPGKLLRVSTNVRTLDGARAVGTYIPDDSPVYKAVMAGETFRGKAFVVNAWYLTAYKPVRDEAGKIVAVIYVGRPIMTPELMKVISEARVAGKGYAFVFNSAGEILFHPKAEMAQKNMKDFPFGAAFMATKDGLVDYDFNGRKITSLRTFEPWDWHIGIGLTRDEMVHGVDKVVVKSALLSGGAALVLSVVFSVLLGLALVKPLRAMAGAARRVGEGDMAARMEVKSRDELGHLAQTFNGVIDSIEAAMAENSKYRNMLDSVSDPIFAVDDEFRIIAANEATARLAGKPVETLRGTACAELLGTVVCGTRACPVARAKELGRRMEIDVLEIGEGEGLRYIKPAADVMRDETGRVVGYVEAAKDVTELVRKEQQLAENFARIEDVNREVSEVGAKIAGNIQGLASEVEQVRQGADLQSQRATETATAMEEMNATVSEVARNATQAADNATRAKDTAEAGVTVVRSAVTSITEVQHQILALKEQMAGLGNQASGIGAIINVISDIADQTNLLALNAAIEAARAGDAGRGFAVVADEVRKLAEKTMHATKEVESAVGSIQSGTRQAIGATERCAADIVESTRMAEESGQRLGEILALVESTTSQVQAIAAASEQQSASSGEINRSVEEVSRISLETAQGMAASAGSLEDLGRLAERLHQLSSF